MAVHVTLTGVRDVATTLLSLLGAVLALAAVGILVPVAVRAWRDRRKAELVVATLEDATSDATTARAATGVTHRLREELLQTLPVLADRWKEMVEQSRTDPASLLAAVVAEGHDPLAVQLVQDIDASRRQLTASIESLAPASARGALQFVTQAMLSPRGVCVSGVLQEINRDPGGVGLSLTVNRLESHGTARLVTIWEDPDAAVRERDVLQRLHDLVGPAARALACELLRQQLAAGPPTARRGVRLPQWGAGARRAREGADREARSREAVVDFVTGRVYQDTAHTCAPATVSFYRLSEQALRRAGVELKHHRVAYLRGIALAELGKREPDDQRAVKYLADAETLLRRALGNLPAAGLSDADQRTEDLKIRALIATTCCWLARKLPDEVAQARAAVQAITELQQVDVTDASFQGQSGVLYNVACAFGFASALALGEERGAVPDRWLTDAKRSLLHACVQKNWWHDAKEDVDFAALHDWLPRAERLLRQEVAKTAGVTSPDTRAIIEAVLAASDGQPESGGISAGDSSPAGPPHARTASGTPR
jgi:hypothetical protein